MKKIGFPLILLFFIISNFCNAQIEISIDSAKNYIGKYVEITDTISQANLNLKVKTFIYILEESVQIVHFLQ